jgi:hypothetical protein
MDFRKNMIVDVFWSYLYDNATGKLVATSKNLVSGGIKTTVSTEEVKNGRGNSLFSVLSSDKKPVVTLKENTFNFANLAMLNGVEITKGSTTGYSDQAEYIVDSALSITLDKTPISNDVVLNMQKNYEDVVGVLNGSKVVFSGASGIKVGDKIMVYPYEITTSSATEVIKVNSNSFPEGLKLILKTFEVSPAKKVVADISFICPNVMCTGEWELNTQAKVQSSEQDIVLNILQMNDNGDLYDIQREIRNASNTIVATPITDLLATGDNTAKTATLTFTSPIDSTDVDLQYSTDSGSTFESVNVGGTTGVRIASAILSSSSTVTVNGLTTGSYLFRIIVTGGSKAGLSNVTNPVTIS